MTGVGKRSPAEADNGYILYPSHDGPPGAPIPPYVQTPEARWRWEAAAHMAKEVGDSLDPSGVAPVWWIWTATRALFHSDIPTAPHEASEATLEPTDCEPRGERGATAEDIPSG